MRNRVSFRGRVFASIFLTFCRFWGGPGPRNQWFYLRKTEIFTKSRFSIPGAILSDFGCFLVPFWNPKTEKSVSGTAPKKSTFFGTYFPQFLEDLGAQKGFHFVTFWCFLAVWGALGAALGPRRGAGGDFGRFLEILNDFKRFFETILNDFF